MSRLATQVRTELQLVSRNGEQLLLTLGIPVLLLVFFSLVDVLPTGHRRPDRLPRPGRARPGRDEHGDGEPRHRHRLRAQLSGAQAPRRDAARSRQPRSPPRSSRVVVVELVQFAVLVPVAYALGWRPSSPNWPLAVVGVVLGTVAFAGIGLTMAGRLRGEINLAAQNGLYLVLLLLGGMVIPFDELPSPIRAVARLLPSGALADVLRETLTGAGSRPGTSWAVLAGWAVRHPAGRRRAVPLRRCRADRGHGRQGWVGDEGDGRLRRIGPIERRGDLFVGERRARRGR